MTFSKGTVVGPYEILSPLGSGGMGEVYRARDTRLQRDVAIKVLPAHLSSDPDRLQRFKSEALTVASLNHPNILAVYDTGEHGGAPYVVTELLEGETLRPSLQRGRLPLRLTIDYAIQVSRGLTAAHEKGIVHRDLKPENLFITREGHLKILDFGLAKLADGTGARENETSAPTRTLQTAPGIVMGTVGYMSPEQARGLAVDARADIFTLGVILYEMATGHAPFAGETASHVMVAILETDPPPLSRYITAAPAELQRIITKALRKDAEERYQTVRDLLVDLRALGRDLDLQDSRPRPAPALEPRLKQIPHTWGAVALLAVFLAVIAGVVYFIGIGQGNRSTPPAGRPETTSVLRTSQLTTWSGLDIFPTLSPDGGSIAYTSDHTGNFEIYVKQLTPGGREIQLTSDGQQNFQPAWSPDGQRIAYYSKDRGGILLVPAFGGTAKQLTDFGSRPAWSRDGTLIAFQSDPLVDLGITAFAAMPPSIIWIVPLQGGQPRQLTVAGNPPGGHGAPSWSPDGKRIVFVTQDTGFAQLWSVTSQGTELQLVADKQRFHDPIYAPDGETIYYPGSSQASWGLWKIRVSRENGKPIGDPVELRNTGPLLYKHLSVSADGKKIALSAHSMTNNLWSIAISPASGEPSERPLSLTRDTSYRKSLPIFSPDGQRIAYALSTIGAPRDIWLVDVEGNKATQVATAATAPFTLGWFPEGDRIAFQGLRDGRWTLMSQVIASGKEDVLAPLERELANARLSPDGKYIAYNYNRSGTDNVWTVSTRGGQPKQLTFDKEMMGFPCWSPDGKMLAFEVKREGDSHIAVISSSGGSPTQLTFDKGQSWPHSWSPEGDKIAFAGFRNGVWNIWWVSRETGKQKQVTNYRKQNAYVRFPAWSPLDDKIVYEYAETAGNIWLMELK